MKHLQPFQARCVMRLPTVEKDGWQLKRYAILAENREFDENIALASLDVAIERLPQAEKLESSDSNHGVGFQLIHYAEVAVVSPIFYWMWGSVLANTIQLRAQWNTPTSFEDGVKEVVGCIWELDIITFEVQAWKETMLSGNAPSQQRLSHYLKQYYSGS